MKIDFLTTDVGRGHRFYLEGLMREVQRLAPEVEVELFRASDLSHGRSRFAWRMARAMYRFGSRSGFIGRRYNQFRKSRRSGESSLLLHAALGRDLQRWVKTRPGATAAVVVDHPLVVELLCGQANRPPVIYMHGELVAPDESLTSGADLTLVPTQAVRQRFVESGCPAEHVVLTGLCIERSLVPLADSGRHKRLKRISEGATLVGAFFSSGAEPVEHCKQIVRAVLSLQKSSQRSVIFARNGGRLERLVTPHAGDHIELITCNTIFEEEKLLAGRFGELDYFVAPSHERTNWALGLGLPFFMLPPVFGSFAPLNWELAQRSAGAEALIGGRGSREFAEVLREMRASGRLVKMNVRTSEAIDGFIRSSELTLAFAQEAHV